MILICMGVSGCGKTTIGRLLAAELRLPFYDADDFHPDTNVRKMTSGIPLSDDDRRPWLNHLADEMTGWEKTGGAVLACSALKASYRKILDSGGADVRFIYLKGDRKLIATRIQSRTDHYMPPALLDSQFNALEEPSGAIIVPVDDPPETIVHNILTLLSQQE
jgi:carbohydrate kinase (thermoresistant glucokinase family)